MQKECRRKCLNVMRYMAGEYVKNFPQIVRNSDTKYLIAHPHWGWVGTSCIEVVALGGGGKRGIHEPQFDDTSPGVHPQSSEFAVQASLTISEEVFPYLCSNGVSSRAEQGCHGVASGIVGPVHPSWRRRGRPCQARGAPTAPDRPKRSGPLGGVRPPRPPHASP